MDAAKSNEALTDSEYGYGNYNTTDYMFWGNGYEYEYVYEFKDFTYPGPSFERLVYMYIWGILVIVTFLANIIGISVLLRKQMRNSTNMILAAIAISDSLTGLVTLPTYWMVYTRRSDMNYVYYDQSNTISISLNNETTSELFQQNDNISLQYYAHFTDHMYDNSVEYSAYEMDDTYKLTRNLCRGFMFSKYFLSKTFHTISIWMTLLLGVQRYIIVALPFRAKKIFSGRNVVITCIMIAVLAPVLHVYHLLDDKANQKTGMCQWDIEKECADGCAYLITVFFVRHFIPSVLLVMFTILFIRRLAKSSHWLNRVDRNRSNAATQNRVNENRRMSLAVLLIVVVFLIPEVPYGGFLLYALIGKRQHVHVDPETNRAVHLAYEISMVLTFHANIYIYTFFHNKFRKALVRDIVYPILTCCNTFSCFGLRGLRDTWPRMSFRFGFRPSTRQSETAATSIEMGSIHRRANSVGRSTTITVH